MTTVLACIHFFYHYRRRTNGFLSHSIAFSPISQLQFTINHPKISLFPIYSIQHNFHSLLKLFCIQLSSFPPPNPFPRTYHPFSPLLTRLFLGVELADSNCEYSFDVDTFVILCFSFNGIHYLSQVLNPFQTIFIVCFHCCFVTYITVKC